eukprot:Partr_v1_DN28644_c1_g1_i2_m50421 putative )-reductase
MTVELRQSTTTSNRASSKLRNSPAKGVVVQTAKPKPSWGRADRINLVTKSAILALFLFCPLMVISFWMACDSYGCSLAKPVQLLSASGFSKKAFISIVWNHFPTPTAAGFQLLAGWIAFQAVLAEFLPGPIGYGQMTPAGHQLPYKVNGLRAWILTHALFFFGAYYANWFNATVIYDNWGALLVAANCYGYFLTAFAYVKALVAPTHADDCKFSGSFLYDMFMGVEFNPRFGKYFDFKLFHNGRPGILAWTLINASFAAAQYQQYGRITNSMVLVNWFHFCYVIDFFINEDWYLRTVDIAHDHFGFYLAWGDSVWLPFMYTLQSHYLVRNPVTLPAWAAAGVFALGMFGYYIFRSVNYQKDLIRRTNGDCLIWGKPAKMIRAKYTTSDGKEHSSILLCSGWWGLARHFNYTGDLVLSLAMCASCGIDHILPWFYVVYMTILLMDRIRRDDARCSGKYGKYWTEYKKVVRWNLIPYIY